MNVFPTISRTEEGEIEKFVYFVDPTQQQRYLKCGRIKQPFKKVKA